MTSERFWVKAEIPMESIVNGNRYERIGVRRAFVREVGRIDGRRMIVVMDIQPGQTPSPDDVAFVVTGWKVPDKGNWPLVEIECLPTGKGERLSEVLRMGHAELLSVIFAGQIIEAYNGDGGVRVVRELRLGGPIMKVPPNVWEIMDDEKRKRNVKMDDAVGALKGQVTITARNVKTGETQVILDESDNLVVNKFYERVAHIGGGDGTNPITKMRFGTSGTAAALTDTTITNYDEVVISDTDTDTAYQVIFTAMLPFGTIGDPFNSKTFREVGLIFSGGQLAARKVYGSGIPKTVDFEWEVAWRLYYTPAP